jgi:hypothetical protein
MVKQNSAAYVLVNHLGKTRHKLTGALHKPIAIQKAIATGLCNMQSLCRRQASHRCTKVRLRNDEIGSVNKHIKNEGFQYGPTKQGAIRKASGTCPN